MKPFTPGGAPVTATNGSAKFEDTHVNGLGDVGNGVGCRGPPVGGNVGGGGDAVVTGLVVAGLVVAGFVVAGLVVGAAVGGVGVVGTAVVGTAVVGAADEGVIGGVVVVVVRRGRRRLVESAADDVGCSAINVAMVSAIIASDNTPRRWRRACFM
jgi:hypothetical protein